MPVVTSLAVFGWVVSFLIIFVAPFLAFKLASPAHLNRDMKFTEQLILAYGCAFVLQLVFGGFAYVLFNIAGRAFLGKQAEYFSHCPHPVLNFVFGFAFVTVCCIARWFMSLSLGRPSARHDSSC
jgi:hypothetical protein